MSQFRTHYDNLKVARNAPDAVIRAAYKALMQKYHPDKFEGTEQEALRIAKLIKQSFDILIDPIKRAEHDRWIVEKETETKQASSKAPFGETASATEQQSYQKADHPAPPKAGDPPPPSNWTDDQPNQKHDISWRMVVANFVVMLFIAYITYPIPDDLKSSNAPVFLFIRIAVPSLISLIITGLFYVFRKKKEIPFLKRSFIIASWVFLVMVVFGESNSYKLTPKEVKLDELKSNSTISDNARDLFNKSRIAEIIPKAEQGDPVAQLFLGFAYYQGEHISKNQQQAVYFFNKGYADLLSKAKSGDVVAQLIVGEMLNDGVEEFGVPHNNQQGIEWITKAAEHGYVKAQFKLGRIYMYGYHIPKNYQQAIYWYTKAADNNFLDAQKDLADIYTEGKDDNIGIIPKDGQKAIYWYTKAAEQGDSESLVSLGHMYDVGTAVPQNYQQAIYWYTKAAELGNSSAQDRLGNIYYGAYAGVQNYILAHMWYNIAAANGYDSSSVMREYIAGQITSDQIQQAQKLATEWINSHPN